MTQRSYNLSKKEILLVGFGSIGKRHANNLLQLTNCNLVVYSQRKNISPDEIINYKNNKCRVKFFSDLNECLNKNPSIAFITNETSYHVPLAIKLAKKRIHLFIEKPLSNSKKNLSTLLHIVNMNKIIVMTGCNFRFYPPIQMIKKLIQNRSIGKIISVQCENNSYLPDWHPYENYKNSYAAKDKLGGGVTLTQIHELDYLTWIFGSVKYQHSMIGKYSNLDITSDDLSISIFRLKNNILVELYLDYFSRPFYKRLKIRGTKGTLYWNSMKNKIKIFDQEKQKSFVVQIKNNYSLTSKNINQMYMNELKYFLEHVSMQKQPMNNLTESIPILLTALKIKNS